MGGAVAGGWAEEYYIWKCAECGPYRKCLKIAIPRLFRTSTSRVQHSTSTLVLVQVYLPFLVRFLPRPPWRATMTPSRPNNYTTHSPATPPKAPQSTHSVQMHHPKKRLLLPVRGLRNLSHTLNPQTRKVSCHACPSQALTVIHVPSEVSVATGNGRVLPTINIHDAGKSEEPEQPTPFPATPGGYPSSLAPVIPDWYKVGWRAVANIDAPPPEDGEEKDKSILGLFLSEQFYGAWYHNAALIFFVCSTSFFLHFI